MQQGEPWTEAPLTPVALMPPRVEVDRRADGSMWLRSPVALGPYERHLGEFLAHWAVARPDGAFLVERNGLGAWEALTYADALRQARAVAEALIDRGLGPTDTILVLSGNGTAHAVLALGAMLAGVPTAPVAPAYSLLSRDFAKLAAIVDLLHPRMVFVDDAAPYAPAFRVVAARRRAPVEVVASRGWEMLAPVTPFKSLLAIEASARVDARIDALGPDDVVKYLFTSGSTGEPKAVPNTHRMLCANQAMMRLAVPPDPARPPVFVDWLPWSHTFGGNVIFDWVLRDGGTLYLDHGRPTPEGFAETLHNLRDVAPTHYCNVPAGYAMLADALERDTELRRSFFERLVMCFYGGSSLPQPTWARMQRLAHRETGRRIWFSTACGSTETGPLATFVHWPVDRAGIVGLPLPGVTTRLVDLDGRYEMRLKGDSIFRGYHDRADLDAKIFDEDGFYRTGDAVRFADPDDPAAGLAFDGRIAEDFKLATGTFVRTGIRRIALLAAMPLVRDAVLTAPDRDWLGALVWLKDDAADDRDVLQAQLDALNADASGASNRIVAIRVLREPPSVEAGEITEKGYVNQRAVLERRRADVERLYALDPCDGALVTSLDEPADISISRAA